MKIHTIMVAIGMALLGGTSSTHAIDFRPREFRTVEDGIPMTRTGFLDGESPIFLRIPKGWRVAGGVNEVDISPMKVGSVSLKFRNSSVGASVRFDEQGIRRYQDAARLVLPKDAQNIEILSEGGDAYPLDAWKSFETWFSYELLGRKSICWVLFITMTPERQICLVMDGDKSDFDSNYPAARRILGSWFEPPVGWLRSVQIDSSNE